MLYYAALLQGAPVYSNHDRTRQVNTNRYGHALWNCCALQRLCSRWHVVRAHRQRTREPTTTKLKKLTRINMRPQEDGSHKGGVSIASVGVEIGGDSVTQTQA